ncbi:WD40-repeat-containing domain protein [Plectosphaerella plurivora]|uniref:WD40-repeat-containing domain protein n=1 Tax=Plectosphaerella plurivora TaxID=936078 RepID=A0A9P8V779_9PEZI|nr:WD40-repeat-containing domain protein [Plectosphaerella plurivora]
MAPSNGTHNPFDLPKLRVTYVPDDDTQHLSESMGDRVPEYFDVQFCPFQPMHQDPIFAAVSKKHVLVCRISDTGDESSNPCSIIRVIRDADEEARNYTCTWARQKTTGKPLLCIAGEDAKIKIYDVIEGVVVDVLVGHGMDINDLITCPTDPHLLASASDDTTVRIWSLDPVHQKQPCLCILAGEGHQWNLLTIAWHDSGRYLVSSGHDQTVNLWTIPDLPTEPIRRPLEVHYPHFSTNEVHSGLVDCVAFYGDAIISRACHDNIIALWRIEGFSSADPPPPPEAAPTTIDPTLLTRSAFVKRFADDETPPQLYTRLASFYTPGCGPQFFMRFRVHHAPNQNPVLAFCNAAGKIFFWDLARITGYHDYTSALLDPDPDADSEPPRPSWLVPIVHRGRGDGKPRTEPTVRERKAAEKAQLTDSELIPALAERFSKETLQSWDGKYNPGDPHTPLHAHKTEIIGISTFVGRQAAWSPGGEWCVVVGSINIVLVLGRWSKSKKSS